MELKTQPFVLNIGPHHPSTHGVFRMRVTLDGEVIVELEPVFGYLHRGIEKLAEGRTYTQNIPFTDRFDYIASMINNFAYVLAVEKLAGIKVPERAEYLRVIMAELMRIARHLLADRLSDQRPWRNDDPASLYVARTREDSRPVRNGLRTKTDL